MSPPTNQKNVHKLITHPTTLSLTVFTNLSLKAFREFRSFKHQLPGLLAWRLQKHCIFLHHNPV